VGHIAISGAGIAGLSTAVALLQRGIDVEIFEQSAQLSELGAGVQIAPNGSRVLKGLGLTAALQPVVCEAAAKEVRVWNRDRRWKLFDLGADCLERFGAPYWFVHRGDLHQALVGAIAAIKPNAIRLGARVEAARNTADGVEFRLSRGALHSARALIAADGVHSTLREQLAGQERAQFTGLLCWRGLVPTDRLPRSMQAPVGTNWIGPGAHVITYPLRAGRLMNVVGIVERDDWRAESWTDAGSVDELLHDFRGWHDEVLGLMREIEQPFKWALLGRAPQRPWSAQSICLTGDACHPTLPFLAQGANMALEDAVVMARCLAALDRPADAFACFEAMRWQRTRDIVNRSKDNAARFHNSKLADPEAAEAYVDAEWQPDKVRTRYDWLFEYDANTVPLVPNLD